MLPQFWTALVLLAAAASATPINRPSVEDLHQPATQDDLDFDLAERDCDPEDYDSDPDTQSGQSGPATPANHSTLPGNSNLLATPVVNQTGGGAGHVGTFKWGVDKVRGVNLGNWFVYESWMGPGEISNAIQNKDQWAFDQMAQNDQHVKELRQTHWETWITETDIQEIVAAGFNHVRIPVGYWQFVDNSADNTPFSNESLPILQKIIKKCADLNLHVILDFHGLPKSQNGNDHSGQSIEGFAPWFHDNGAKARAVEAVKAAVKLFSAPEYRGIVSTVELVNEPNPGTADRSQQKKSGESLTFLKGYFTEAYNAIREINNDITVLFSDGWMDITTPNWAGFGTDMTNVAMDTHYYTLYDEGQERMSGEDRLKWFCGKNDVVSRAHMPTMVGEWSLTVPMKQADRNGAAEDSPEMLEYMKKSWAAQTATYERGAGWTYWSWKTAGGGAWSMKWLLEKGVVPHPITQYDFDNVCKF